ncbi:YoaK family protein [Methylobacterium oryzihabitans]|uniref:DUF1275 domain-containing protein n=1 Tax=Methylobacterium oryzihabitans TaxID=2499852 RepID=A0A437P3G4_9HYPH|nr:YoaK family protein [Methylobacterium oryzihabitans]RVU16821.1 DUF1275 domain-containing protein [Methylobacterium oryzihabitans]
MLIHEGLARTPQADRRLAWSLAGTAGALNAAGFDAVGLFSSNMTGHVSTLADHLGLGDLRLAAQALVLVAAFVLGAMASTLLINLGRRRRIRGVYAYSILAEAVLLALLGGLDLRGAPGVRGFGLILGLSLLLGLQNAVVTRLSGARVRTTHVTGMVTDIGIGLANLIDQRGDPASPEAVRNRETLRLHGVTVAAFLAGGVVGVVAYRLAGAWLLLAAAAFLAALAAPGIRAARRQDPADS